MPFESTTGSDRLERTLAELAARRFPARLSPSDERGAGSEKPLEGKTVLVIEDEFFIGLEIVQVLEDLGANVVGPAQSLAQAERLSAVPDLDAALVDVNLKGEHTLNLARELLGRGIYVIFVTAYANETKLFSGELTAVPRLSKPTSPSALRRALDALN